VSTVEASAAKSKTVVSAASLQTAVTFISSFGDTDVFPLPIENHWFHDDRDTVVTLLAEIDKDFDTWLSRHPVQYVRALVGVGYSGFRAATQIDPIWNAYLLALTIEVGRDIEAARVPTSKGIVFSYRFSPAPDSSSLFDRTVTWGQFQQSALAASADSEMVVSCDISDFYSRIYHHRLENALNSATANRDAVKRIIVLLTRLSENASYGLPVGGDASRLLAELLLNRTDKLLGLQKLSFMRFVDDYYLFASDRESAHRHLVFLSNKLLQNEGLTLSRNKTRFFTRAEFARASPAAPSEQADSEEEAVTKRFLQIRLSYNPYSPTAEDDYERLSEELKKFDILAMLTKEFQKSRIDESVVKQLVKSIRFLTPESKTAAVKSLLDNLQVLYPVFTTVAILLRRILEDLDPSMQELLFERFRTLFLTGSHITLVPANAIYAVRLLAHDRSEEAELILAELYRSSDSDMMLKRDIILAMARRRAEYWLSDVIKNYATVTPWERRALLAASYVLGDEGRHWRKKRRDLSPVDEAYAKWLGGQNSGRMWEIPL